MPAPETDLKCKLCYECLDCAKKKAKDETVYLVDFSTVAFLEGLGWSTAGIGSIPGLPGIQGSLVRMEPPK